MVSNYNKINSNNNKSNSYQYFSHSVVIKKNKKEVKRISKISAGIKVMG